MSRSGFSITCLCACFVLSGLATAATVQNFNGGTGQTPYVLSKYGADPAAQVVGGAMRMVSTYGQNNMLAFSRTDAGLYGRIVAEWDLNLVPGADGMAFILLDTSRYGASGAGPNISGVEEPSLPGCFAVGFDVYCPDDYQKLGSHEISLHWDNVERANKWSPFDYRTGTFNRVRVVTEYVAGGAEITVSVAGTVVYDKYFLAGMTPYESRVAFGARTGGLMTTLSIDNINVVYENPTQAPAAPLAVRTFDKKLMNGHFRDVEETFNFPADNTVYERVILKLTVEEPSNGWDPWDRMMGIWILDPAGTRYEIARFMTPYSKAGTWWIDVTDYQTLLRGSRRMHMWLDSWIYEENKGYLITTDFYYYKGNPKYRVLDVRNLWVGTPVYGNLNDPTMSNFFKDKQVAIPLGAAKTKLRFMVTGHGQHPNTDQGAEFIQRGRTVTVNGGTWYNKLWRNDCYLNPCRPQSGTWIYSRAGWAPGDRVWPWDIDITGKVTAGQTAAIDYAADPYYNYTPDTGNNARHWVESQIIFYAPYSEEPVARWTFNENEGTVAGDSSGSGYHGTLTNMDADSWTLGKQCGGLAFDGVDDCVEITGWKGVAGTVDRTCAAWVKTTEASGEILSWGDESVGGRWIVRVNEGGQLRAEVYGGNIVGTSLINDGLWHHIAVVLESDGSPDISEVRLYVDGRREAISTSMDRPVNTGAFYNVHIGVYPYFQRYFSGRIDEARIYNRALESAEIEALYLAHALTADLAADGRVDLGDFAVLASRWQRIDACEVDLSCDCTIDLRDLAFLADEWLCSF